MNNDYRLMEPPPAEAPERCPCCGSTARVWEYIDKPDAPIERVVMCDQEGSIGPRDALMYEGCLLQMPPQDFYRSTGREAVAYWNGYAKALAAHRKATRGSSIPGPLPPARVITTQRDLAHTKVPLYDSEQMHAYAAEESQRMLDSL